MSCPLLQSHRHRKQNGWFKGIMKFLSRESLYLRGQNKTAAEVNLMPRYLNTAQQWPWPQLTNIVLLDLVNCMFLGVSRVTWDRSGIKCIFTRNVSTSLTGTLEIYLKKNIMNIQPL